MNHPHIVGYELDWDYNGVIKVQVNGYLRGGPTDCERANRLLRAAMDAINAEIDLIESGPSDQGKHNVTKS